MSVCLNLIMTIREIHTVPFIFIDEGISQGLRSNNLGVNKKTSFQIILPLNVSRPGCHKIVGTFLLRTKGESARLFNLRLFKWGEEKTLPNTKSYGKSLNRGFGPKDFTGQ